MKYCFGISLRCIMPSGFSVSFIAELGNMAKALSYVFFLVLLNIHGSLITITSHIGGFSIPLIHRDAAHHHRHHDPDAMITTDVGGPLVSSERSHLFFLNASIGEPPLPQLLAMDTGSDMSWVICTPCQGCPKPISPTYDHLKSSSYSSMACHSENCTQLYPKNDCSNRDGKCKYDLGYLDGTNSSGSVGYEKFTFMTSDEGLVEVQNAIFGCGEKVYVTPEDRKLSGMFGLGTSGDSIISATGSTKFSYCIGNISDPSYRYNMLIIGDGAIIQGDSTPMTDDFTNQYYVRLEGISIGEKVIEYSVTMLIDSGTSLTYIPKFMLDPLKAEVRRLMNDALSEAHIDSDRLCFSGDMRQDLGSFPSINLWFGEGLIIELDVEGAFYPVAYSSPWSFKSVATFCLAFMETEGDTPNTFGVIAQQYFNVGFNLEDRSVSFQKIDCELLDD